MQKIGHRLPTRVVPYAGALAVIAVTTGLGFVWVEFLGQRNLALLFMLAIAGTGGRWGVGPAIAAAVTAFLLYHYFLVQPRFQVKIAPADFLALASFLFAALALGTMSGMTGDRARTEAERAKLAQQVAQAEMIAEREALRTALLSSLSHDLRTPISTILTSASSLMQNAGRLAPEARSDMLLLIREEAERLNRYVEHLLSMTRLASGAITVQLALTEPAEAIQALVMGMRRRLSGRVVTTHTAPAAPAVLIDLVLWEQAMRNIVENAIVHAGTGSTIALGFFQDQSDVVFFAEDAGPGIPPEDHALVFDKFFRGRSDRDRVQGAGLGLSVAKGLIEAQGGQIRLISPARDGRGTRFEIVFRGQPGGGEKHA